jgi:hypothetical protein
VIEFSWAGKIDDLGGTATFVINGTNYRFNFPAFETANQINGLLRMSFEKGRLSGVEESRRKMLQGLDSIK